MTKLLKELMLELSLESEVTNVDTTGTTPVESQSNAVTYDEGKGRKDVIVMDGPLSEIYTRGLNLYFAKGNPEDGPEIAEPDSVSVNQQAVATESAQIQQTMTNAAMTHLAAGSIEFEIVADTADLDETPTASVMLVEEGDVMKPETIVRAEEVLERSNSSDKDYVFAVIPPAGNYAFNTTPSPYGDDVYIDLDPNVNKSDVDTFKAATESFYATRGIKVVFGAEGIANWIGKRVGLSARAV